MTQRPKRILVTGSSGFLGAAVAARLTLAGHEVLGFDPASPLPDTRHRHRGEDLSDADGLLAQLREFQPEIVVHAGGVSGPMMLADQPGRIMAVNVRGSLNLLDASMATGVQRFVFCSSISAVGEFVEGPLPDDPPMRPNTTYGASKAAVDQVLGGLHRRCPMQIVSLRFTTIYGPGRLTAIPLGDLVAAATSGTPLRVPRVQPSPYIFIDDAAVATIAASFAEEPLPKLFYNIAHPELVSLADVASALAAEGFPCELIEDESLPRVARGALAVEAAARDFGFRAVIAHRAGIARMLTALRSSKA
jgi:UDP-glucose 4-epimerase